MNKQIIIQTLIDMSENRNYMEIGVGRGNTFVDINSNFKVGVDPISPNDLIKSVLNENCIYHPLQSDAFFYNESNINVKFDVVFVDGFHEYEQAYRDIVNSLNHLATGGFVVVHDCKPYNRLVALPAKECASFLVENSGKNKPAAWTGDVWKAIVRLRSFHNDLHIFTLDCDMGVAIITRGKPENLLSFSLHDINSMTYDDFSGNCKCLINLKPYQYLNMFLQKYRCESVDERKKILYGAGHYGEQAWECYGEERVYAFADINKYGTKYLGKPVIHPSALSVLSDEYEIVICAEESEGMIEYLKNIGVEDFLLFL